MNTNGGLDQWQSRLHHITRITKWIRTSLSKSIPIFIQFKHVHCLSPIKKAMLFTKRVLHALHPITDSAVAYPSFSLNEGVYVSSCHNPETIVVLPENITTYADAELGYIANVLAATVIDADSKVEAVFEMDIPYRWEGIHTLIYNSNALSSDGQRVIDGFEAAEGETIDVNVRDEDIHKQLSQIGSS